MTTPSAIDNKRETQKRYRERHKEMIKAYALNHHESDAVREKAWRARNVEKQKEYYRAYTARNRERIRDRNLRKTYGISQTQWDAIFDLQGRKCGLCLGSDPGKGPGWVTDHDHLTGYVRGILCRLCNVMIGHAREDVEVLKKAIAYLENPPNHTP